MIAKLILWVADKAGVSGFLASVIVYGGMALIASGTFFYAKHNYDEGKREEGRIECRAQAAERAAKNKTRSDGLDADRERERIAAEAAVNAGVVVIMAAEADACSEADALPSILERLK